jgi:photosystem II stability/assembly factor-like uncharacterized protein
MIKLKGKNVGPTILLFIVTVSFQIKASAQNYANNWVFGNYEINFNGESAEVTRTFAPHLNRGMGVISDANGGLLFYTDGYSVWNRKHQIMPNGSNLIPSTMSTSTQQSMVIPKPGSNTVFYIFTVDPWNGQASSGLYYSEVHLQQDGGLGDVVVKGVRLVDNTTNNLSAAFHKNQRDVWVLTHEHATNKYHALLITEQGISNQILNFNLGPVNSFWNGQLKFSPDGKHVALSSDGVMILFDFDVALGTLSNPMTFSFEDIDNSPILAGLDFSSDATKVYVAEWRSNRIYQFDLSEYTFEKIRESRTSLNNVVINNLLRQFQLAPDGKIYITKGGGGGGTAHLGVINNLNAEPNEVLFIENGLYLEGGDSFVNFTPSFIQNYFFKTSFRYDQTCEDEQVTFTITNEHLLDSVKWFFGEGSSTDVWNPDFVYTNPGEYTVTMLAYYNEKVDTIKQSITINSKTSFELGPDVSICSNSKIGVNAQFNSYAWSTGDTTSHIRIAETNEYTLTTTNEFGCTYKDSITVTVEPLPVINLRDTVTVEVESGTALLFPGGFPSYEWSTGENTSSIEVAKSGWYSVLVTSDFGCIQSKSVFVKDKSSVPQINKSEWVRLNPTPTGAAGADVHFIDDQTGFILTREEILRTTDGGNLWEVQMKITGGNRITFSGMFGYVVGNDGAIYKSTHHGGGWNKLSFNYTDDLESITSFGDTLVVTSENSIFVSENAGSSWSYSSISGFKIQDSFFTSSKIGHAISDKGIIKTSNRGITWQVTSGNPTSDYFNRIFFVDKNVGYATRGFGDVYKTINGGTSWSLVGRVDSALGVYFINQSIGFVVGSDGAIHKTINGGATWSWSGFNGRYYQNDIFDIHFTDENVGFATGLRGRIIKTTNGGITWKEYAPTYNMIYQLDISNETDYALVGNEIMKTQNGGYSWSNVGAPIAGVKCGGFDFISKDVGYALVGGSVGTSGTTGMVYKTENGGKSWKKTHNGEVAMEDLTSIIFIDENIGFVSGGFNWRAVMKTINGGITWNVVAPFHASEIQMLNAQIGFACSDPYTSIGKIYKTSDAGNTWQVVFEHEDGIKSIHFVNELTGYAVGDSEIAFKTIDGGATWQSIEVPYGWYLDVKFFTEQYGFILDDYGKVFKTYDGGHSWINDLELYGLRSIEMTDSSVFVAGDFGSILKKDITFNELIYFDLLSAQSHSPTDAVVQVFIKSGLNLENAELSVELGLQPGVYNQSFDIETLNGFVTKSINFELTNLEQQTRYYCRYVIKQGDLTKLSDEISFETQVVTGINQDSETQLVVYPNPAKDLLNVSIKNSVITQYHYELKDMVGNTISVGVVGDRGLIDVSSFSAGMYFLSIVDQDKRYFRRIVIQ